MKAPAVAGHFSAATALINGVDPLTDGAIAWGDFNNDGFQDFVTCGGPTSPPVINVYLSSATAANPQAGFGLVQKITDKSSFRLHDRVGRFQRRWFDRHGRQGSQRHAE